MSKVEGQRLLFTADEIAQLPGVLSEPRFKTYLDAQAGDAERALALYRWNLELSARFLVPLQICEVCVRNSIANGIERSFGPRWPWSKSFEISLPDPNDSYSPRRDLMVLRRYPTTGKIVAELRFVFWEKMLTGRHDNSIWNQHFRHAFPYSDGSKTVQKLRAEGYSHLFQVRDLRNRIAHHEPIFRRDTPAEYRRMRLLISWSSLVAASWIDRIEGVTAMQPHKP